MDTQDLWRIYKTGTQEVTALNNINLKLAPGSFVALKGRSGSGKTTLLNCLGGLDRPTRGKVTIFGDDVSSLSDRDMTSWRREKVGFVFQSFGLLPTLSAYENVELILRIAGVGSRDRHNRSLECLKMVGLGKWIHHRPYELSGGQQQRLAIARALANHPRLILADEPTGELDTGTATDILGFFRQIVNQEGLTMLVASHDSLVDRFVDKILRMSDGQIVDEEILEPQTV
ncbi:MAG: ABC transporter ATP-binding protein [Anaerolineaceae bacterium]|nr:ABC transporter ATP-binding protein [Anaerolineaceae bacterium]